MRGTLRGVLLLLPLLLSTAAWAFTISLPAESAVKIDSPSRLLFSVTNTDANEGLSRLVLRFPSGYRVTGGSAPPGWTVEQSQNPSITSSEISFRTSDEAKCTGAAAPGGSLIFGVEVIASASRSISPDHLMSAQAEQSCRGVILDPQAALPSWNRLGIEATLTAGPTITGLGGVVTARMTVTNLSTVELPDVSPRLRSTGTGSVSQPEGPAPAALTLAPGASASVAWTGRATSAGMVSFSGQAVVGGLISPPVRSDPLFVGDLEASLTVTPEQMASDQEVRVEMTVTNRGPVRVVNVTPSSLTFDGTAAARAAAGPTPPSRPALEPGESATFAWATTLSGQAGDTYAFSAWAWAEYGAIVSANATSNRGALARQDLAEQPGDADAGDAGLLGGDGLGSDQGGAGAVSTGGTDAIASAASAIPSATLQFIGVNHDGRQTPSTQFLSGVLRDLRILVSWQNATGTHSQRLDLFAPDGSLYQRVSAQFSGTPVETRLPVGGTWITQSSLFGAWRVDVFLDNGASPVTSGVFLLTP